MLARLQKKKMKKIKFNLPSAVTREVIAMSRRVTHAGTLPSLITDLSAPLILSHLKVQRNDENSKNILYRPFKMAGSTSWSFKFLCWNAIYLNEGLVFGIRMDIFHAIGGLSLTVKEVEVKIRLGFERQRNKWRQGNNNIRLGYLSFSFLVSFLHQLLNHNILMCLSSLHPEISDFQTHPFQSYSLCHFSPLILQKLHLFNPFFSKKKKPPAPTYFFCDGAHIFPFSFSEIFAQNHNISKLLVEFSSLQVTQ